MFQRKRLCRTAVFALAWLLAGNPSLGSEHEEHGEPFHKYLFGGFLGITGEERRERALTLGLIVDVVDGDVVLVYGLAAGFGF